jgi:hypothetical protein
MIELDIIIINSNMIGLSPTPPGVVCYPQAPPDTYSPGGSSMRKMIHVALLLVIGLSAFAVPSLAAERTVLGELFSADN